VITLRKGSERGHVQIGWLDSRHTFSFGDYYDPAHMHWGPLRVINEDHIAPGAGFPTHPHRDMEIVTWVLSGTLAHKDSTGTEAVIRPGELQRMSAGTGIRHSEYNASANDPVHLLQIWLLPDRQGLPPGYEQKSVTDAIDGRLGLVGSPDGRGGSLTIHQDVELYATRLKEGEAVELKQRPGRVQWVQVARGEAELDTIPLSAGDGAAIEGAEKLSLRANQPLEALIFDMAA
jgi:redox-sensitive bicupin YhaK (pirin superfamily)